MNARNILAQMSLEEKASLCSGKDFWNLKGIERLNVPSIMVTDGPHGLRKQEGDADHVGLNHSVKATCFPTASATASSWNRELMHQIGVALAEESLAEGVSVLLGPGVNIKRSPLCGRNFEYISEDPYLTGEMAAAYINGVQSQGVGTSLKHFAVNNQEYRRMVIDAVLDERTLREIYLPGFEISVKKAQPWTVMCAYNKVNGSYCSEHPKLLTDILKKEWGHQGLVVTDWGACNDRVEGLKAGLELEMPSTGGINDQKIVLAVQEGRLDETVLDEAVLRLLTLIENSQKLLNKAHTYDPMAHHQLAKKAAEESAVLLKNDHVLPLESAQKVLFVGEFFESPRYQGSGSSLINPRHLVSAKAYMDQNQRSYAYCQGYSKKTDQVQEDLIQEALRQAESADCVVIFAGLTDDYESEGFDRQHLNLPKAHEVLIERMAGAHPKVVVVLQNGAPVAMPWRHQVSGILEAYLGGEAGGEAVIDLLYGQSNPSGKLAETFPIQLEDCLSHKYYRMGPKTVEHREGLYVGYRYFDTYDVEPMFAFGYGLTYTKFHYSNLRLSKEVLRDDESVTVTFDIENIGNYPGAEIPQIYVSQIDSVVHRPEQELKGFDKVFLAPGDKKTVSIVLDQRAFAYYNVTLKDWHAASGDYMIKVGSSSRDIHLTQMISLENPVHVDDFGQDLVNKFFKDSSGPLEVSNQVFEAMIGRPIPGNMPPKKGEFHENSTIGDVKHTFIGKMLHKKVLDQARAMMASDDASTLSFLEVMMEEMPIRNLAMMSQGQFSPKMMSGLLHMINGQPFKGLTRMMRK